MIVRFRTKTTPRRRKKVKPENQHTGKARENEKYIQVAPNVWKLSKRKPSEVKAEWERQQEQAMNDLKSKRYPKPGKKERSFEKALKGMKHS